MDKKSQSKEEDNCSLGSFQKEINSCWVNQSKKKKPCWERRRSMAKFWFILHSRSAARISCSECSLNISCKLWTAFAMATSAAFTSLATSFARFLLAFDFPIFFRSRDSTCRRTNGQKGFSLSLSLAWVSRNLLSLFPLSLSLFQSLAFFILNGFVKRGKIYLN